MKRRTYEGPRSDKATATGPECRHGRTDAEGCIDCWRAPASAPERQRPSEALHMPDHRPDCGCVHCEDLRDRQRHGDPNLPGSAEATPKRRAGVPPAAHRPEYLVRAKAFVEEWTNAYDDDEKDDVVYMLESMLAVAFADGWDEQKERCRERATDVTQEATSLPCACKVVDASTFPPKYDQSACPTHGPNAPRFFVDHGCIHDRVTSLHVPDDHAADPVASMCALLNALAAKENERG